jgi:hypothetical protein
MFSSFNYKLRVAVIYVKLTLSPATFWLDIKYIGGENALKFY